jgi:DNA-binding phage protein
MAEDTGSDGGTATDAAAGSTDTNTGTAAGDQGASDGLGEAGKRALDQERRARRVAEKELEKLRAAAMTDQDKAIAAAKTDALAEANRAAAPRLVRAELRAAAAEAGLPKEALDGFLEYADLSRFLTDDGEPDSKAIAAAVKRLGGNAAAGASYDGGARGGAARPLDMSALIRQKAGVI